MLLLSAVTQKSDVRKSKDIVFKYYVGDSESHTYSKKKKLLNVLNYQKYMSE